jgi:O-antigen/teichoic acid export membrane protein
VASTLAQTQLATSLVAAALLAALAPLLASWLGSPELIPYLRILALGVPLFGLAKTHRATLIGLNAVGRAALVEVSFRAGQLALVLLIVALGWSVTGAILASLGASVLRLVMARIFVRPPLFRRPAFPLRRLLGYAFPLFFFTIGMRFFYRADLMVVKALGESPAVAGYYGAAQNLTIVPFGMFGASFSALVLATLPKLWQREEEHQAQSLIGQAIRLVLCFLPLSAVLAGSASGIADLVLGRSFSPAAPLVAWLAFAALGFLMISVTTTVLTAAGRPGWTVALTAPVALLALGGYLLLVPRFGAISAAATTTVLAWASAILTLFAVHRWCGVRPRAGTILRTGLMALIAFTLSLLWRTAGAGVVFELIILTGVVIGGLFVLGELKVQDWAFAQSLFVRQGNGS